ncbi:MAG: hypothetical protein U9M90_04030 [Patescibacteria group bacterium]|nr:hypothetical protein [Patescibacteria group bacterium]
MSKKGNVRYLVKALKESGYFSKELIVPSEINQEVVEAIKKFLQAGRGDSRKVRRVVRVLKKTSKNFRDIRQMDVISPEVKKATEDFLEQHA